jgi:hypothetical protein
MTGSQGSEKYANRYHPRRNSSRRTARPAAGCSSAASRRPNPLVLPQLQLVPPQRRPLDPLPSCAIVIPTNRPLHDMPALVIAAQAAEELDAQLVIIRSGKAAGQPFPAQLAPRTTRRTAIIDLPPEIAEVFPRLASDQSKISTLHRKNDISLKRNLAQLLALKCGWEYLLMLDDDMRSSPAGPMYPDDPARGLRATDVVAEFQANRHLQAVGYTASDFPDHSVLGHVERRLGRRSEVFLGGSLRARVGPDMPFFSRAYNEDWLWVLAYLIGDDREDATVMTGGTLYQSAYEPFKQRRARSEELGDVLAEGLFQILAHESGGAVRTAACDADAWEETIRRRRLALADALRDVTECYSQRRSYDTAGWDVQALDSMGAALALYGRQSTRALAVALSNFVADWLIDVKAWRRFLVAGAPAAHQELSTVIDELRLTSTTTWIRGGRPKVHVAMGGLSG